MTDPFASGGVNAAILARVRAVEDRLAIMELEAEYARAWDAADGAAWAAVFTDDGVFDARPVGDMAENVVRGRAALTTYCDHVSTLYRGLHFMHLPRLRIDGERAVARLHFQWTGLFHARPNHTGRRETIGYYDVTYRRVGEEWRIAYRVEKLVSGTFAEDYDVYLSPELSAAGGA